ncbi:MAG TPA: hypothetical protein PK177_11680, partial [Burkholderiaceae bacterium]|nr:hypothetical protein [Burkholderiaceae bacterium]
MKAKRRRECERGRLSETGHDSQLACALIGRDDLQAIGDRKGGRVGCRQLVAADDVERQFTEAECVPEHRIGLPRGI